MCQRCVENPFAGNESSIPQFHPESAWQTATALLAELDGCVTRGGVPESTGRWTRNPSVYTGLGGVGVAFLRAGLHCRDVRQDPSAASAFLEKARDVANACLSGRPGGEVSFFCGAPGHLAIAHVACSLLGEGDAAEAHLGRLVGWAPKACRHKDDELLFGRAGYLYALLWVRSFGSADAAQFDEPLQQVAEALVASGRARAARGGYTGWPLMWHCFDEPYIGAAHGVVGCLAMLLHCFGLLTQESQAHVAQTLEKLLSVRFQSGNLPIILGEKRDEHIHWCHGAPGIPALIHAASSVLGDDAGVSSALLDAARRAGEVVWERGIILKGYGLCHGITGNAYTFLTLYRMSGDEGQLRRAAAFASLLEHQQLQAMISRHPDRQRRVQGVPDSPSSLMEGTAGVVCFLLDMCRPHSATFPGWEF